jgi:arylsulfatase A-like enzyme
MDAPNVLLVVLDAVRRDHLSCYGYDRPTTPEIDRLAERGTRYDQAVAAAPWTPPSHAVMFSGQYPSHNGVFGPTPHYAPDEHHLAALLSDAGYSTFGFSNSYHTSTDRGFDRGFDFYHDILELPRFAGRMYEPSLDFVRHLYDYFVRDYDDSAFQLRRLRTQIRRRDRPFFGFINLNSAHAPYDPPEPFASEFAADTGGLDEEDLSAAETVAGEDGYPVAMDELHLSEGAWDVVRGRYDGEIRYMDHLLGQLFAFLEREGVFEETLVVVTADHGELFGEHGLVYHQFTLAEELLGVPLVVKPAEDVEGIGAGAVDETLVSLVDLAPTILHAAGLSVPEEMDGRRLGVDPAPETVFAEYAGPYEPLREKLADYGEAFDRYDRGLQAVRTATHKLVAGTDGSRTLYDVSDGETPVEDDELTDALAERIEAKLGDLPDRAGAPEAELDDHVADHLEEMGYM